MRDLVLVAAVLAFFALASLYVRVCDRIVGPDEAVAAPATDRDAADPVGEEEVR